MKKYFVVFFIVLGFNAYSQVISLESKVDSIIASLPFEELLHQIYPYDVLNTGDNPWHDIRGFYMADGPHGYRYPGSTGILTNYDDVPDDGKATSFPISVAIAATWDVDLAYRMANEMGKEFVARGSNQTLAPALYLCNEPRNGRSGESYGEDPFLASEISIATVNGIQSHPTIATIKSFIGENAQDTRMTDSITIGKRMLMEHWGVPFRKTIHYSNALSVMSAYVHTNDLNQDGVFYYSSENYSYNTEILRDFWGFPYYMVSDWGAVHDAPLALESGLDVCMGSALYASDLWMPIIGGTLSYDFFENSVKRVIRTKLASGIIGWQPSYSASVVGDNESIDVCYEAGAKSLVLLKNEDNILPLNASLEHKVAIIGPSAIVPQLDGYGSSYVFATNFTTVYESVVAKVGEDNVIYAYGCDINTTDVSNYSDAISAATEADYVIFVGGLDWQMEGEEYDRITGSTELPGMQQDLINQLAAVNPNIIVTLLSGGIVSIPDCVDNIKGLIYGFYPGQEQGNAIADVIYGDFNPGGKLPVTMPVDDSQLPPRNNNFNDDWGCGYRWFDKQSLTPQFAFGFGLSYTTFSYNSINILDNSPDYGQNVIVEVNITNTGDRFGEEVVQLYLTFPDTGLPMPDKQLKGFSRIGLESGESTTVLFEIEPEDLYVFDETIGEYDILTGLYTVKVGGSSDNLPLLSSFTINPAEAKPDLEPTALLYYPPYPRLGDTVIFYTNIINKGLQNVNNTNIQGQILVENQLIAEMAVNAFIHKGGMIQAEALGNVDGNNYWIADETGNIQATINLDTDNTISECNESNNSISTIITVYDTIIEPLERNLAWKKPITVSSVFDDSVHNGDWAVDGLRNSKWLSLGNENEFVEIDLQAIYQLKRIVLKWSSAYANEFIVFTSVDQTDWNNIADITDFEGGNIEFNIDETARFIRIETQNPENGVNFGLYEVQAYGLSDIISANKPVIESTMNIFPNPSNKGETIRISSDIEASGKLCMYDISGHIIKKIENVEINHTEIEINDIPSGVYYFKFIDSTQKCYDVGKLIIAK